MKKIALLLTLICTNALNGMEPKITLESLDLQAKDHIITALNTYDDDLDDIIYAIKAMSITSKTFQEIINEKYGTPEKLTKLAHIINWNFASKALKARNDFKALHHEAYEAIDIWNSGAQDGPADVFLYSKYYDALDITQWAPPLFSLSIGDIIQKFKTPAAKQYPQMRATQTLLDTRYLSSDTIRQFIDDGIMINYRNSDGITPLLHALEKGSNPKAIQLLLDAGVDPLAIDKKGKGVFDYLDSGYPENHALNKHFKAQIHPLLTNALNKQQ